MLKFAIFAGLEGYITVFLNLLYEYVDRLGYSPDSTLNNLPSHCLAFLRYWRCRKALQRNYRGGAPIRRYSKLIMVSEGMSVGSRQNC